MRTSNHPALNYVRHHRPETRRGEVSDWICIDERNALINGLYRQTAGGAAGVGQDIYLVHQMAAKRRNARPDLYVRTNPSANTDAARYRSVERGLPQTYVYAGISAETARVSSVELHVHEGCAAELSGPDIAAGIVSRRDDVWERIRDHARPGFNKGRFNQIVDNIAEANENGWLENPSISGPLLNTGFEHDGQQISPVDRVALRKMDHIGRLMLLSGVEHTAFDVRAAVEAGEHTGELHTVYHASLADMGEIYDSVRPAFPVLNAPEARVDFEDITFVRNSATSLFLPQQEQMAPALDSYDLIPA